MLPEEPLAALQSCLDTLVVSHFPIQSDEFAEGSLHRNNYMDCIRKVDPVMVSVAEGRCRASHSDARVPSLAPSTPGTCRAASCWMPWSSLRAPSCSG